MAHFREGKIMKNISILLFVIFTFQALFTKNAISAEIYTKFTNEEAEIFINGNIEMGDFEKFVDKILYLFVEINSFYELNAQIEKNKKRLEKVF